MCFELEHLFISVAGSRSIMCGVFSGFCSLPPPSLLSTVYQCNGCLSSCGRAGSWLGCQVLPAISAVSILELAANSGSSRMSRAPNLYTATKLFIVIITLVYFDWLPLNVFQCDWWPCWCYLILFCLSFCQGGALWLGCGYCWPWGSIAKCEKLFKSAIEKRQSESKENISE